MHQFFFFLTLVFLPTQLGYHFWPSWSMVLGRRVDYLSPTLFLTDILILFLIASWMYGGRFSLRKITKKMWIVTGIVFVFTVLNIYLARSPFIALFSWIKCIEFFLVGWYIVQTKPSLLFSLQALSIGVLYSSGIALVQFTLQHSIGGPVWFLGERTFTIDTPGIARSVIYGKEVLRAYATFPHPNVLAGFLAALLPLFLAQLFTNSSYVWRRVCVAAIALGTVALAVTLSRSAWVIYLVSMCWVWYQHKKHHGAGMLAVALSVAFFAVSPLSFSGESIVVRAQLNVASFSMIQQSPWFGVGLGNFLTTLPDFLPSRTIYFLQPVHNIYLLLLSEIGIVGIGVLGWIVYRCMWLGKYMTNSPFAISLVGVCLLGLVDHYLLTLQQGRLLFALLLGFTISHALSQKQHADTGVKKNKELGIKKLDRRKIFL